MCSVVELISHKAHPEPCDVDIPHSIIIVNISSKIEVRALLQAILNNDVYFCYICCWYDFILVVYVCPAFSLPS